MLSLVLLSVILRLITSNNKNNFTKVPNWNFGKYLVAANGEDVQYFPPKTSPLSLSDQIEQLISMRDEL